MPHRWLGPPLVVACCLLPEVVTADDGKAQAPRPWDRLGANAFDSYLGWSSLFHLAGIGATAALAPTGADWEIYRFLARNEEAGWVGAPAFLLGYVGPVAVVGGLYLYGWRAENDKAIGAGAAVLQALAFSGVHTTVLKLLTGRYSPRDFAEERSPDRDPNDSFRFGFNRGGFIKGWPSGHTGAAVAIGVTLASYYDAWWIDVVGYFSVVYMGYGMVAYEGGYHWTSDVVAAALMNFPIARTIGKSFRAMVTKEQPSPQGLTIVPTMLNGGPGLVVGGAF